jgi:hypothetical protein
MTESIYQIPGDSLDTGESIDVPQQTELSDARVNIALRAVRKAYRGEYLPSAETLRHTRIIDIATRLHTSHRNSVASDSDISKAA